MRYWIWLNDLVQGPFELEELTSLRSFSEDLMVCMEDRQDWLPASRVADLSSAIEQIRVRRSQPLVPPPPPPRRPPTLTPLQGEFFGETPGQQPLLESDDEPRGPYAYRPDMDGSGGPYAFLSGQVTMPFHFRQAPQAVSSAVLDLPRPRPQRAAPIAQPVIVEEPPPLQPPPQPQAVVALKVLQQETAPEPVIETIETAAAAEPRTITPIPDLSSPWDDVASSRKRPEWWPWMAGVAVAVLLLGSGGYWVFDRASTRSAIAEANRLESPRPATAPAVPMPVGPAVDALPAPVPARPAPRKLRKKTATIGSVFKDSAKVVSRGARKAVEHIPSVTRKPAASRPATAPEVPAVVVPVPAPEREIPRPVDVWAGRQNDAIKLAMAQKLPRSKVTVGSQAATMLLEMHEKELLHAAETGERLYLPDKIAWSALQEAGTRYRVYLNFMAWQVNGERVQTRSYQFVIDLKEKTVQPDDELTRQDLLTEPAELRFKHHPMAGDIESILGGVDAYNKHQVQLMIVKKKNANREGRKSIQSGMLAAQTKVKRAVLFFRRNYTEKSLQNIAKAYSFSELLKG